MQVITPTTYPCKRFKNKVQVLFSHPPIPILGCQMLIILPRQDFHQTVIFVKQLCFSPLRNAKKVKIVHKDKRTLFKLQTEND